MRLSLRQQPLKFKLEAPAEAVNQLTFSPQLVLDKALDMLY